MSEQEFQVKLTMEKEFSLKANSESEAKEKAMELLKSMISKDFNINVVDTYIFNATEYNEMMKNIRDVVIDYMDRNSEGLAESHIEAWEDRYRGKSKDDVEFDLNVNYDINSELYTIEESLREQLKDETFEFNDSEVKYIESRFIEAVLENF